MHPYGQLAGLLAAVGLGVGPAFAGLATSPLLAQQALPTFKPLYVAPNSTKNQSPSSTQKKKKAVKTKAKKKKVQTKTVQKKSSDQAPKLNYPLKPFVKPKPNPSPLLLKPPVTKYPVNPSPNTKPKPNPNPKPGTNPWLIKPPITTFPLNPSNKPQSESSKPSKPSRASFISLRKPILACRSFRRDGNLVRGFRARLYGRNPSSVAASLTSKLTPYQSSGGSLSRCIYSGVVSPKAFSRYFKDQKPSRLTRSADNYNLPLYSSFSQLIRASGGNRARFGLVASTPSVRTSTGKRRMLRISANNALILFVDGRNQSVFKAPPSRLPLRLVSVSSQVREALSGASKSSLKRIIDYKKLKKIPLQKSSRIPSEFEIRFASAPTLLASALSGGRTDVPAFPLVPAWNAWQRGLDLHASASLGFIAELDPQVVEQCMQAQDFSGCVETLQGSSQSPDDGTDLEQDPNGFAGDPETAETDAGECAEGEIWNPEAGWCDDLADGSDPGGDDSESEDWGLDGESEDWDLGGTDEPEIAEGDDNQYDDGGDMYPPDMGAPTGPACTGQTFGEQFACALLSALTSMLQQAFTSN